MCKYKCLDDIEIQQCARKCGIRLGPAKKLYKAKCDPSLNMEAAINQAIQQENIEQNENKQTNDTIQILKDSFQPISSIHKDPTRLIKSIKWFSVTNDDSDNV